MTEEVTLLIYGASDDLVEIKASNRTRQEYTLPSSDQWQALIIDPQGNQGLIYATYHQNETWTLAFGQAEEDIDLPTWKNRVIFDRSLIGYSVILELTVPAGTIIKPQNDREWELELRL